LEAQKAKESITLKTRVLLCERASILANVKGLSLIPRRDLMSHIQAMAAAEISLPVRVRIKIAELLQEDLMRDVMEETDLAKQKEKAAEFASRLVPISEPAEFNPFKPAFGVLVAEAMQDDANKSAAAACALEPGEDENETSGRTDWQDEGF
jgi:hypothetical protein